MKYKINYEALYNRVKNEIEDQLQYWRNKEAENYTVDNKVRAEVYGRLQSLLIGYEKNAIDEAIDDAYTNKP